VAEPPSLLAVGRVRRELWTALGLDQELARFGYEAISISAPQLAEDLSALVDPNQPIELAVAVDSPETLLGRGPDVVVSIPLSSRSAPMEVLRERQSAGQIALERRGRGAVEIVLGRDPSPSCWLMDARGAAPARLVCGSQRQAVASLGPWVARGLPERDLGAEALVLEAWPHKAVAPHVSALRRLGRYFLSGATSGGSDEDRFLGRSLPVLFDDGIDALLDTEHVRLGVEPDGDGVKARLSAELSGTSSWTARTLKSLASGGHSARDSFAKLPADTQLAWFFEGPAPERIREARGALAQWLRAYLGPGYEQRTIELVVATFVPDAPVAYAEGDAYGKDASEHDGGYAIWERTLSTYGWHVMAYSAPSKELLPRLEAGMKAYNSGDLGRFAYAELPRLCKGLGKIRKKPLPRGMPPGSAVFELPLPGKFFDACAARWSTPRGKPAPNESIVVVMVPDGDRTWIGFGPRETDMVRRVTALAGTSSGAPAGWQRFSTLLGDESVRAGGFSSLAGFGGLFRFLSMSEPYRWRREYLSRLLNRGEVPAAFSLEVRSEPRLRADLTLMVPGAVLADLQASPVSFMP
jgi:hypothetical protein